MLKERLTNTHWSTHMRARCGVFPRLPLCLAAKFGKLGAAELKTTAWEGSALRTLECPSMQCSLFFLKDVVLLERDTWPQFDFSELTSALYPPEAA